ncbi:MAG TPA: hypothetical protein VF767_04935 [Bryobacteraceae bacterium]
MRHCISFVAGLALSFSAFAQHQGGGGSYVPRNFVRPAVPSNNFGSGFGRVVYPGTGRPPVGSGVTFPFATPPTTFVERLGDTVSGRGYTGVGYGGYGGFRHYGHRGGAGFGAAFPIIYPVPVYLGGDYYSDPAYYPQEPQQQTPNITIIMPPQPAQAPAGTAEAPPGGVIHNYQAPSAERPEPSNDQVVFFIALKDSSVYTALAYWVEDGTLHYITSQGKHNQVSLDLVDRATSAKLNEGRKVEFRLPPAH